MKGGEFLLHTPGGQGIKQLALLLVYVQNLTPPFVLAGPAGHLHAVVAGA